ncbi:Omp28-related outer membrane protein [Taibaiella koreensis]|uniref:Omp28-related outer membrane protein n=1 Tax=Taibaiella koreensis TaxID=1268548 RepID=UPI000E59DBEF|nr:Omp28-related outer membrane protein [Taibaiella koreensis]
MKKTLIGAASALLLFAASCKEHGVPINLTEETATDTTYVGAVETPQAKRVMIEELSGVICVNCPQGAAKLEEMSTQNPGAMTVVTVHAGNLTDPIPGKSKQNLRTDDGENLIKQVWAEQGAKPCAAFDRLPIGNQTYKYFVAGYVDWPNKLQQAKTQHSTSPVKLSVTSAYNDAKDAYEVEATVSYTEPVTDQYALHLFLTEDGIIDAQELSATNIKDDYEFNHVFRKAITPVATGKPFLTDVATKEAGRVYVYRTSFKIDKTDEKQKFWEPKNMKVIFFVAKMAPDDIRIVQVQETKLIP